MKKEDLIRAVAKKAGIPHNVARTAVEAILGAIMKGVKRGPVLIDGFGKFRVQRRRARMGRNPRTGETIQIAPTAFPVFIAGDRLQKRMRKLHKRSKE
ncbi:MAG: HU family DNA-binding protein [bacterium]